MQTEHMNTAHSLFVLCETLTTDTQQAFLQELLQKQQERLENAAIFLACQQTKEENDFLSDQDSQAFLDSSSTGDCITT